MAQSNLSLKFKIIINILKFQGSPKLDVQKFVPNRPSTTVYKLMKGPHGLALKSITTFRQKPHILEDGAGQGLSSSGKP